VGVKEKVREIYFLDLPEIFGGSRKKIAKKNKPIKDAKIKV
jgi:hypothetical protein